METKKMVGHMVVLQNCRDFLQHNPKPDFRHVRAYRIDSFHTNDVVGEPLRSHQQSKLRRPRCRKRTTIPPIT